MTYPISLIFTLRKLITILRNSHTEVLLNHSLLKSYKLFISSDFRDALYMMTFGRLHVILKSAVTATEPFSCVNFYMYIFRDFVWEVEINAANSMLAW